MSALDPATRKLIYEAIASLPVALVAAWLLFGVFFDSWSDYWMCCRRPTILDFLSPDQPDISDRSRGFIYNAIWLGAGGVTFYYIHKYYG